jgi:D-alanyl-D-alanine carboxypeptidase
MPDLALSRQLHAVGQRAVAEARLRRAGSVGAEHVLLAIASDPEAAPSRALAANGLDYVAIVAAIERERVRSLAVADRDPIPAALTSTARRDKPGWGASVRELLRTADKQAAKTAARSGDARALETELVVSILRAEVGTVPRMLAIAGVDRRAVIASVRRMSDQR